MQGILVLDSETLDRGGTMGPTVTWPLGLTPEQFFAIGVFCTMGFLTLVVGVLMVMLVFMRRPR